MYRLHIQLIRHTVQFEQQTTGQDLTLGLATHHSGGNRFKDEYITMSHFRKWKYLEVFWFSQNITGFHVNNSPLHLGYGFMSQ